MTQRGDQKDLRVLVADPIADEGLTILRQVAEVDSRPGLDEGELTAVIAGYDALVVRSETQVTARVIEAGKRLKVVARAGVGVDNIDVEAATARGLPVVNAPDANTVSAAEHTVAMMLALARHIPRADAQLRAGKWGRGDLLGTELRGKTLGLVGLGRVGSEVARRTRALEMRVVAHDPFVATEHARNLGVETMTFEELLRVSDFVSLHVPLTSATRSLIGEDEIALMSPTAHLINVARGGTVDEEALSRALDEGRLAGAALDVFGEEPATDSPLLRSEKTVVTPHLGASTAEAQTTVAVSTAQDIVAVLQGRSPRYAVNLPYVGPEATAVVAPFSGLAEKLGAMANQLAQGQLSSIAITYEGELAQVETMQLRVAVIRGLLGPVSEEGITMVNANRVLADRGIGIEEKKGGDSETFSSLITVQASTSEGETTVAGSLLRGEPHIVLINGYWIDIFPAEGCFLISDHRDRPGLIGTVGTILGDADINISSMQVGRLERRGQALMVLGLDEEPSEEQRQRILSVPDVDTCRLVKL